MTAPAYVVTFRGFPACPCLAEWLPVFERELLARGVIRTSIDIAQLIGSAPASAGVHKDGGAFDVWQHDPVTQLVAREMGAAAWNRLWADNEHTHGVLKDCPHNGPARYQIAALAAGFDGTGTGGRGAPDYGPGPRQLRTWRQGIAWAHDQQEERDMAEYGEQILKAIRDLETKMEKLEQREKDRDTAERDRARTRHEAILALLDKLEDDVADGASKAQVKRLRVAVAALANPDSDPEPQPGVTP